MSTPAAVALIAGLLIVGAALLIAVNSPAVAYGGGSLSLSVDAALGGDRA